VTRKTNKLDLSERAIFASNSTTAIPVDTASQSVLVVKVVRHHKEAGREAEFFRQLKHCPQAVDLFVSCTLPGKVDVLHEPMLCHPPIAASEDEVYGRHFPQVVIGCCAMVLDALAAMDALRNARILHRDISPNNFLYSAVDWHWKLVDFGCACYESEVDPSMIPPPSPILGTRKYMHPDLRAGQISYSYDTDRYAMCETLSDLRGNAILAGIDLFVEKHSDWKEYAEGAMIAALNFFLDSPSTVRRNALTSLFRMLQETDQPIYTHYNVEAVALFHEGKLS
jgi:serine/threonine protein kinase